MSLIGVDARGIDTTFEQRLRTNGHRNKEPSDNS
jgi:hypothetical protein